MIGISLGFCSLKSILWSITPSHSLEVSSHPTYLRILVDPQISLLCSITTSCSYRCCNYHYWFHKYPGFIHCKSFTRCPLFHRFPCVLQTNHTYVFLIVKLLFNIHSLPLSPFNSFFFFFFLVYHTTHEFLPRLQILVYHQRCKVSVLNLVVNDTRYWFHPFTPSQIRIIHPFIPIME